MSRAMVSNNSPGAQRTYSEMLSDVLTAGADANWTDEDLTLVVPAGTIAVQIAMRTTGATKYAGVRKNGSALDLKYGVPFQSAIYVTVAIGVDRIVELYAETDAGMIFYVVGYWA